MTCPWCGKHKTVQQWSKGVYHCTWCKRLFDDDPDEGGAYSNTNPAARMEYEERHLDPDLRRNGHAG